MDHISLVRHPGAIMKTSLDQAENMNKLAYSCWDFRVFVKKDNKNYILYDKIQVKGKEMTKDRLLSLCR